MAFGKFFVLFDDIAVILDDVAVMTKIAAKKTAGVLGDDLALNAQQVTGVSANRELPVVWAVFKGSLINKTILVPLALLISFFAPWLVTPLLMIGGAYLCFEGVEKLVHTFFHSKEEKAQHLEQVKENAINPEVDILNYEKDKIKGAVRTDFILSAEIIAITLGVVSDKSFINQVLTLCIIAFAMTIFVYGLVAVIVKLDDVGFWLNKKNNVLAKKLGLGLIYVTPYLMKTLSIVGTLAMFLVGGGIITHGIPVIYHFIENTTAQVSYIGFLIPSIINGIIGVIVGAIVSSLFTFIAKLRR